MFYRKRNFEGNKVGKRKIVKAVFANKTVVKIGMTVRDNGMRMIVFVCAMLG
jgi:hypothetical protein